MAEQPGLLEEGSAVVVNNDKPDSDVRRGHLNVSGVVCGEAERPEMDTVLEDMLHNIDVSEPLTKREGEVLRLVVSGKTNKEIARILCRTERTVEYHRNRLMRKLDAHNAADLVKRAISMGVA